MTKKPKVEYYSCDDDAISLTCTDEYQAISEDLEQEPTMDWPKKITVYGYAPFNIKDKIDWLAQDTLDCLLERLDEEYGHHDQDPSKANDEMQEAAKVFMKVVIDNYSCSSYWVQEEKEFDVKEIVNKGLLDFSLTEEDKEILRDRGWI